MKFRYLIVDTCHDEPRGTQDPREAQEFADDPQFYVLDAETGEWIDFGGERHSVVKL